MRLQPLATLSPPSSARTWQSTPHPSLPIIATASSDRSVRVYSLTSFTLLSTLSGGHKRSVRSVSWKPGTRRGDAVLATGSFDASAGIWRKDYHATETDMTGDNDDGDDEDYAFTVLLDGHESEIKSVAFSATSRLLATCSRDKSVWIWEELEDDNWETVAVLQEHEQDVKCVAWHPTEELLASASYDDTIRLYKEDVDDWMQIAILEGHEATVWWVAFEGQYTDIIGGPYNSLNTGFPKRPHPESLTPAQKEHRIHHMTSGPRLISCSDDLSIRVWIRNAPASEDGRTSGSAVPSILRTNNLDETWSLQSILPRAHDRAVYSVAWSTRTGMVVSAGSDGRVVVYHEIWVPDTTSGNSSTNGTNGTNGEAEMKGIEETNLNGTPAQSKWVVLATLEAAHDVFEINHVTWANRWDKGRRDDEEEVIITTGDDGEVKVWELALDGIEETQG